MNGKKLFDQLKKGRLDEVQMMYALAAVVGVVAFILLGWFALRYYGSGSHNVALVDADPQEQATPDSCDHRRRVDGVCVDDHSETNPRLVLVTVENHPDARPQSGLAAASVVYEYPVEANYTRFLLVFDEHQEVSKVGPVRSVRPYFLDAVQEYGQPLYMHVGGSPEGLDKIKRDSINSVNEFYHGWLYWRSSDRYAPHNVYTSSKLWTKGLSDNDIEAKEFEGWTYGEMDICETDCVMHIEASFLPPTYKGTWQFNTSTGKYTRYQTGSIHRDQDGTPIMADTVIVERVETEVVDDVGRLSMETVGEGDVLVFRDGHVIEGRWKKESPASRTVFLDSSGKTIQLKAGKIWVEVVNERGSVTYE